MITLALPRVKAIQPRRKRQLFWLNKIAELEARPNWCQGLPLHVSGGYAYDKDLRDLVDRGLLKMHRKSRSGWASLKHGYVLSTSVLRLTDEGRKHL